MSKPQKCYFEVFWIQLVIHLFVTQIRKKQEHKGQRSCEVPALCFGDSLQPGDFLLFYGFVFVLKKGRKRLQDLWKHKKSSAKADETWAFQASAVPALPFLFPHCSFPISVALTRKHVFKWEHRLQRTTFVQNVIQGRVWSELFTVFQEPLGKKFIIDVALNIQGRQTSPSQPSDTHSMVYNNSSMFHISGAM